MFEWITVILVVLLIAVLTACMTLTKASGVFMVVVDISDWVDRNQNNPFVRALTWIEAKLNPDTSESSGSSQS